MERDSDLVTVTDDKGKFFKHCSHLFIGDEKQMSDFIEESVLRLNEMEAKLNILRKMTNLADSHLHNNPEWEAAREQARRDWEAA